MISYLTFLKQFLTIKNLKIVLLVSSIILIIVLSYQQGYNNATLKFNEQIQNIQTEQLRNLDLFWKTIEEERRKNEIITVELSNALKKTRVVTKEVIKYVDREIEKTVYNQCVVPVSGVSAINDAASQFNSIRSNSTNKTDDSRSSSGEMSASGNN